MKRVQSYTAPGTTVTFDPQACIHSAVYRWIRPEAATVAEVTAAIDRCPSGALNYVLDGPAEPPSSEDVS